MIIRRTFAKLRHEMSSSQYLIQKLDYLSTPVIVSELEKRYLFSSGTRCALIKRLRYSLIEKEKMILWAKRHQLRGTIDDNA